MLINFDGMVTRADAPVITSRNRGFRYADGLFETILVAGGQIRLAQYHFDRLISGLGLLHFKIPASFSRSFLADKILEICQLNQLRESDARVRLTVFRGEVGEAEDFPHYIIEADPFLAGAADAVGLSIGLFPGGRKSTDAFSHLKSNNYLLYSMAAAYAREHRLDDCLILNTQERICESSISNLFCIMNQEIYTPPLSEGCIAGVLRRFLLESRDILPMTLVEQEISLSFLHSADEIFLTNALRGIRPVARFGEKNLSLHHTLIIRELVAGLLAGKQS